MTGQQLYNLHLVALADFDSSADSWDDIDGFMRQTWDRTTELIK